MLRPALCLARSLLGISALALTLSPLYPAAVHAQGATVSISKLVSVNGLGFHPSGTARSRDTLTYDIYLTNSSAVAAANLTVTDYLQPGQTPLTTAGAGCTYASSSRIMTCTVPTVGAKSTVIIVIVAAVDDNFRGTLYNTASMSGGGVPAAASNRTTVFVGPPVPVAAGPATFLICGTVTVYSSSGITVAGAAIPLAPNATLSSTPIAAGDNLCLTLTLNASTQIIALAAAPNLPAVNLVCDVYSSFTPGSGPIRGVITLDGIAFPVEATVLFPVPLVAGQPYCFLLTPSGVVNGILSSVPTAAWSASVGAGRYRVGREWVE